MDLDRTKLLLGKMLVNQLESCTSFCDAEFSVFSQFGDDGIIQYIIKKIKPQHKYFIEFGVENYLESNTRFLLQNDNWSGFVMDGSAQNIKSLKAQSFFWKHDLIAAQAFVTAENIESLLLQHLPTRDIGLLHIDIDGNDYWIWNAIVSISPIVVIMEYNAVFGATRAITVPYASDFERGRYHYSNLYAGASLAALRDLGVEKGYGFVGTNNAGNNAYFVRRDYLGSLKELSVEEGFTDSKFRESRTKEGQLNFLRGAERAEQIKGMKVFNTRTKQIEHF